MKYLPFLRKTPLALVVDDDLPLRIPMCAALEKVGFDVIEAENGREAIVSFKANKPDLVLLDVVMPEMDGFETCKAIRDVSGGKDTQILMVTGLDDTESVERAFEVGANDFVAKPLNWIMLGHRCKYMLRAGRAIQAFNRNEYRLSKTQELAKLGNWEINLLTDEFYCSTEAGNLLGLKDTHRQITFDDFFESVVVSEQNAVKEHIFSAIKARRPFSSNYRIILPNGAQRFILNRGEIVFNENGVAEVMLAAIQDVSLLKNAEEEIRQLAFYDGLTGVANRMLFMNSLEKEIASAKRHKRHFALLFLDLDQFKRINDTFGHHIGDLLLKNVSDKLQKCIRASDTASRLVENNADAMIARLGGDEFVILLSDIKEPEDAAMIARRILHEIPEGFNLEGHRVAVTTSIGISIYPTDGQSAEELLKHADSAMYHAKETGKNNYQFYKESLNVAVKERFSIEHGIQEALAREEFILYFQPQVELSTLQIVGVEALIRWLHPQKGIIPPDKFIHIAEESGFIIDINKWVIQAACQQNSNWRKAGLKPMRIAVNLSGYHFARQDIIHTIKDALQEANLDAHNLEVEITENVLMQDTKETISILEELKDLSLRIALDDFGTGYSSLSYITAFPVDIIKIDRSFVMGCTLQQNNLVIIKAIIAMGHSLGLKIVAEGIETEEQFLLMKELGVDEGQGFYFSPPVSNDAFAKLLLKENWRN